MTLGALAGRGAIVTGGSRGLGQAIARAFLQEGAEVLIAARDPVRLREAEAELRRDMPSGRRLLSVAADVSDPAGCNAVLRAADGLTSGPTILVNNAGVYGPIGPVELNDWSEWVDAVRVNLFGTVLMCRAVVPAMRSHRYGKIVNLSGGGATAPLPRLSAYAASKAAVVRFTETLAHELAEVHIDVNAMAPGPLNTRLLHQALAAGPERLGAERHAQFVKQLVQGGAPLGKAAALAVFLASAESDGITGRLLSALWDDWPSLPARRGELAASELYTLRRVSPGDGGGG